MGSEMHHVQGQRALGVINNEISFGDNDQGTGQKGEVEVKPCHDWEGGREVTETYGLPMSGRFISSLPEWPSLILLQPCKRVGRPAGFSSIQTMPIE